MRIVAAFITAAAMWALPGNLLGQALRRGQATARSTVGVLAACEAAKQRANVAHCGPVLVADKAVDACECSADGRGWTCRVRWAEMCQRGDPVKTSRAVTSTHRGSSRRARSDACYAAEVDARRQACPKNVLRRDVSACLCEMSGATHSCLVDQTLYCHR